MLKVAFITGANRGLGLYVAKKLHQLGWTLYVTARDITALDHIYKEENIKYSQAFPLDLFKETLPSLKNIFAQLPLLSVIIHCASPYATKKTLEFTLDEQVEYGTFMLNDQLLMRMSAEKLLENKEKSILITTGAVIGMSSLFTRGLIGLAKAQQRQFSGILQHDLEPINQGKFFVRYLNLGSFREEVLDSHKVISTDFVADQIINIIEQPEHYEREIHLVSESNEVEYNVKATVKPNNNEDMGQKPTELVM